MLSLTHCHSYYCVHVSPAVSAEHPPHPRFLQACPCFSPCFSPWPRSRRRGDALEALSNKQTRVHGTLESHLRRARRGAVPLRGFDARILGLPVLVPRRPRRGFHPSGSPTRAAPSTRSDQSCLGKRKIRREFEPGNRFTISRQMSKRGSLYSKRRVRDLQPICGRRGKCAPSFIQASKV